MDRFKVTVNTKTFGEANKALEETVDDVKDFAVEKMEDFVKTAEEINDMAGFEVSVKTEAMEGDKGHIEDISGFKVKVVETLEDAHEALVETGENIKDFAVEKIEDFVETTEDVKDFAVEKMEHFKEEISLGTDATIKYVRTKLEKLEGKETVKLMLRRETLENSAILNRVGERPFLLELLVIVQSVVILLMLGLVFLTSSPPPPPSPPTLVVPVAAFDWLRLLLDLLALTIIPFLVWLLANSAAKPYRGVKRLPWGEESLLREDTDESLWFFGPAGENNYRVAGVNILRSGKRLLEKEMEQ